MTVDKCPSCGSDRLYQFDATPRKGAPPKGELPQVCRSCSSIIIDGAVAPLPDELGILASNMAEQAEAAAVAGGKALERTPGEKIDGWLQNYFKAAYLDGFMRALAYWNHHGKEGRLIRMRELWNTGHTGRTIDSVVVTMPSEAYTEFEQLLNLSPGATNATSTENKHPPVPQSPA